MKAQLLFTLLALPVLNAQDSTSTMSMEERKASVVQLKENIEAREERLQELIADIKTLDERTEKKIDRVIDTLKRLEDSESSKTRITRLKGEVIEGLRKSINAYATERRKIFERIRTDQSGASDPLNESINKIDARIEKRASQIIELAKSMPQGKDVKKYEGDGGDYYNGWYHEDSRISEEWRQNRRQGVATENELRDLTQALEGAIEDLDRRIMAVEARLKDGKLSPANTILAKQELARNQAMLSSRKKELLELSTPAGTTSGDEANKDTADRLKEMFEDARGDIQDDHWAVLKKYDEAVDERESILKMQANLEAREKWLSENAGE
ncbi:hypothetical protein ACFQY0_19180 [Haloferula chungangensis]|uniref:Chromosome segregation ATPase n=1 Tax=Haloferula chungangensis TaxID=1048331 RepID=A0ABW2LC06_9BACT